MVDAAEKAGWPYEIHTLEDLAAYYFGARELGNMPWTSLKEKTFLLHMQDSHDDYDIPEEAISDTLRPQAGQSTYTNYTCGPAYMKWHSLVFGMETNHRAITDAGDMAESGMVPCGGRNNNGSLMDVKTNMCDILFYDLHPFFWLCVDRISLINITRV